MRPPILGTADPTIHELADYVPAALAGNLAQLVELELRVLVAGGANAGVESDPRTTCTRTSWVHELDTRGLARIPSLRSRFLCLVDMGMDIAARVAHRYLRSDAFIRLDPTPVMVGDGGVITPADLERALHGAGIEARDLVPYRLDDDPLNVFRWEGRDPKGNPVLGRLLVHLAYDSRRVVVSAEIVLASTVVAT